MKEIKWQVVCVRRGSEKRVCNYCKSNDIEHYCPFLIKTKQKGVFIIKHNRGYCFDGFVFVKCEDALFVKLMACADVYHSLCWFGKRVSMTENDMTLIKKICQSNKAYHLEQLNFQKKNNNHDKMIFNRNVDHTNNHMIGPETYCINSLQIKLTEISATLLRNNIGYEEYNYEKYYYWL
jgi:hypothetical protein